MLCIKSKILISSALILSQESFATEALVVSSIDWCPQLCSTGDKKGYVMDTVQAIFKDSPYQLEVKTYPWSRAIKTVENGQAHALLSPAKEEAPNLIFPEQEIGIQRMCFFTKSQSDWKYTGPKSLVGIKVGLALDTSIEELNSFISNNPKQFEFIPYSDSFLDISLKKTQYDRIDTFLFTYNSTKYELNKKKLSSEFREAGCVTKSKIYMAFSPISNDGTDINEIMNYFNTKMKSFKKSGKINNIMSNYGLRDWQEFL